MSDRTLPIWVKIVLVVSALMQAVFGLRLLFDPASIQPPTVFGYISVVTPVILLGMGIYLLMPSRSA